MKQQIKKHTMSKLFVVVMTIFLMVLSVFIIGDEKVFAAGGVTEANVEVEFKINSVTNAVQAVNVEWGSFIPGINLYRLNLETMEEEDLGNVSSGGVHSYTDSLSNDNGPKNGMAYMYRIGNGTDFSAYSVRIDIPDLTPTAKPNFDIKVSSKTFTIEYNEAYQSISSTSDFVFERSPNGTDNWTVIKTYAKGTYESKDDFTDKITEDAGVETEYFYRAYYKNEYGQGPYSEVKSAKTEKINIDIVEIDSVRVIAGMKKADIDVAEDVNDFCTNRQFELWYNGTKYGDYKIDSSMHCYITIPIHYGIEDEIKVVAYGEYEGKRYYSENSIIKKVKSLPMAGTSINGVTKINANQVGISWNNVDGVEKYDIYKGSTKVATVDGSKDYYTYKKKGAGKGSYKVVAKISETIDGKTTEYTNADLCKASTPKANVKKFNSTSDVGEWAMKCYFRVSSVKLTGKTYTVTGYAVNKRYFTCLKWKKMTVVIKAGGKTVAKKTYKNYKLNLKGRKSKKITFKIKGKAGADLYNLGGYSTTATPDWND